MNESHGLPTPAPAFVAHFPDPIYDDVANELAPFGSDEGADMLAEWANRRDELGPTSTVADVLEDDPQEWLDEGDWDSAVAVHAAGFTLLRLTGQIDPAGRKATLKALDLLQGFGEEEAPELEQQRRDLAAWKG